MIRNWTEFDDRLRRIALIDISVAEAEQTRASALVAAETAYDTTTRTLLERRSALADELEAFYRSRKKEVEAAGKRSIELTFGRAGMRKGNPKLALLKGWKWKDVLLAIKEVFGRDPEKIAALIKSKEAVNKDAVKSQLDEDTMAGIGVKVRQGEEFFFETFPDKVNAAAA